MPVEIIPLLFPPFLSSHLATARASDSSYMLDRAARVRVINSIMYVCTYV